MTPSQDALTIVNISESPQRWQWVSPVPPAAALPQRVHRHSTSLEIDLPGWWPKRYPSSRALAAWHGSGWAGNAQNAVLVTHGPRFSFYAEASMVLRRRRARHLAFTFTFTDLPTGLERRLMARALRGVDRFVSFSSMEPAMYAQYFDLPIDRFEWQHWGVSPPQVEGDAPCVEGDYICALGIQARDYASLLATMRKLPAVRLVLVATPQSLGSLSLPDNVQLIHGIPFGQAMNVLAYSRFMVLPLRGGRAPCGHSTLVPAMHLGKPIIVTESAGVSDYVRHGETGLTVPPQDPQALRHAVEMLHDDAALAQRLGEAGQRFGQAHCTEGATAAWFGRYLQDAAESDSQQLRGPAVAS